MPSEMRYAALFAGHDEGVYELPEPVVAGRAALRRLRAHSLDEPDDPRERLTAELVRAAAEGRPLPDPRPALAEHATAVDAHRRALRLLGEAREHAEHGLLGGLDADEVMTPVRAAFSDLLDGASAALATVGPRLPTDREALKLSDDERAALAALDRAVAGIGTCRGAWTTLFGWPNSVEEVELSRWRHPELLPHGRQGLSLSPVVVLPDDPRERLAAELPAEPWLPTRAELAAAVAALLAARQPRPSGAVLIGSTP